jgi:hypothetical protein
LGLGSYDAQNRDSSNKLKGDGVYIGQS